MLTSFIDYPLFRLINLEMGQNCETRLKYGVIRPTKQPSLLLTDQNATGARKVINWAHPVVHIDVMRWLD